MLAETDLDSALVRSFRRALRACACTSIGDRVATMKETVSAKLRDADAEWEVSRVSASVDTVARKSDRSCVVQRECGAVPTRLGAELVPSEASDSCSESDSEQQLLASCVACGMAGAVKTSHDDPTRVVLARLTSEEVRVECFS